MQQQQRQVTNCDPEVFLLVQGEKVMEFEDWKTRELYSVIARVGEQDQDEKLMKEAQQITELKSLFHGFKSKQLQTIKEDSYAYRGVTLRQKAESTQFAKNRTYSIIKATKERKKTLTQADFQKIFDSHAKTKEILYQYSMKTEGTYQRPRNEQSKSTNGLATHNGKSSRKDLRSLLSTRMNQCSLQTEQKESSKKAKSYKFLKMSKAMKAVHTEKQPCNIFNFMDGLANKQSSVGCFWQKIELISKPKKAKPWI